MCAVCEKCIPDCEQSFRKADGGKAQKQRFQAAFTLSDRLKFLNLTH